MRTLISGGVLVVCALSGQYVLVGTESSGALLVVGAFVVIVGFISLMARQDGRSEEEANLDAERDQEQYAEYQRAKEALIAKARSEKAKASSNG